MPTGYLTPSPEYIKGGQVSITTERAVPPWAGYLGAAPLAGARTDTQPVNEPGIAKIGSDQPMFGMADWYNRIHFTPQAVDVGDIVGDTQQDVVVWNAYLSARTLQAIIPSGNTGITLSTPGSVPFVFEPLRERTYGLLIDIDGPAVIDAAYLFDFDVVNMVLNVDGRRIVAWTWRPDWSQPMIERLEWMTNVLTAYDGTEQRIKLRGYPRRAFEFSFSAQGKQRRRLDSALYGWGTQNWALPIWPDGTQLTADVAIGANEIMVSTATRDYTAGGLAMLLSDDGSAHEAVSINSVLSDRITLVRPTVGAWPAAQTMLYPARIARLPAEHGVSRFTSDIVFGKARFEVSDNCDWPAASETTYLGMPVMTDKPNWIEDINSDFVRKLAVLDFGNGVRAFHDESGTPEILQTHRWLLSGRTALGNFRSWLYSRAGKYTAAWVPSWSDDIVLASMIGSASVLMNIEHIDYVRRINTGVHRKDIRIQLASGAVHYRRITAAIEIDANTERLTIDSALGVDVQPSDVVSISFMALCRMDADGVEISWFTGDAAEAAHPMRGIKQ